jgi:hypothetical protein
MVRTSRSDSLITRGEQVNWFRCDFGGQSAVFESAKAKIGLYYGDLYFASHARQTDLKAAS